MIVVSSYDCFSKTVSSYDCLGLNIRNVILKLLIDDYDKRSYG